MRVKDRFLFKSCSFVDACIAEDDFFVRNISSEFYCRMVIICMPGGGGGDSHMEQTGMLVGNFKFNP